MNTRPLAPVQRFRRKEIVSSYKSDREEREYREDQDDRDDRDDLNDQGDQRDEQEDQSTQSSPSNPIRIHMKEEDIPYRQRYYHELANSTHDKVDENSSVSTISSDNGEELGNNQIVYSAVTDTQAKKYTYVRDEYTLDFECPTFCNTNNYPYVSLSPFVEEVYFHLI